MKYILIVLFLCSCTSTKYVGKPINKNISNEKNKTANNFEMGDREPIYRHLPEYQCLKEGHVVVSIVVDRSGKVIEATPRAKGTTTTEKCLIDEAIKAALLTTWQPDINAPKAQNGKLVFRFKLQ